MKSNLLKIALLGLVSLSVVGCGSGKKEEPITNKDESTIIKDATSTHRLCLHL